MARIRRFGSAALVAAVWLVATGCGGKDDTGDTGLSGLTTGPTTGPTTDTQPTGDGVSPVVITGTIYCFNTGGTSNVDTWVSEVAAEDPQGLEDLASFGSLLRAFTNQGDAEVYSDVSIVCQSDGLCTGSVSADVCGIPCDQGGEFYWTAEIIDDSGNSSGQVELTKIAAP